MLRFDMIQCCFQPFQINARIVFEPLGTPHLTHGRGRRCERCADGGAVECAITELEMRIAELLSRSGNRGISKYVTRQHRSYSFTTKALTAPTQARADGVWKIADRERLRMSAISPIGDEKSFRAMLQASSSSVLQIRFCVVEPADQRHPSGCSRADIEW